MDVSGVGIFVLQNIRLSIEVSLDTENPPRFSTMDWSFKETFSEVGQQLSRLPVCIPCMWQWHTMGHIYCRRWLVTRFRGWKVFPGLRLPNICCSSPVSLNTALLFRPTMSMGHRIFACPVISVHFKFTPSKHAHRKIKGLVRSDSSKYVGLSSLQYHPGVAAER